MYRPLILLSMTALVACSVPNDPSTDGESHWRSALSACAIDDDCANPALSCLCGVCTQPCDSASCSVPGATCAQGASCDATPACLAECDADADCAASGLACVQGFCQELLEPLASMDATPDIPEPSDMSTADMGADMPASNMEPVFENCYLPGDEDGNQLEDCADPACAGLTEFCSPSPLPSINSTQYVLCGSYDLSTLDTCAPVSPGMRARLSNELPNEGTEHIVDCEHTALYGVLDVYCAATPGITALDVVYDIRGAVRTEHGPVTYDENGWFELHRYSANSPSLQSNHMFSGVPVEDSLPIQYGNGTTWDSDGRLISGSIITNGEDIRLEFNLVAVRWTTPTRVVDETIERGEAVRSIVITKNVVLDLKSSELREGW